MKFIIFKKNLWWNNEVSSFLIVIINVFDNNTTVEKKIWFNQFRPKLNFRLFSFRNIEKYVN